MALLHPLHRLVSKFVHCVAKSWLPCQDQGALGRVHVKRGHTDGRLHQWHWLEGGRAACQGGSGPAQKVSLLKLNELGCRRFKFVSCRGWSANCLQWGLLKDWEENQ